MSNGVNGILHVLFLRVFDVMETIVELEWQWEGHVVRQREDNKHTISYSGAVDKLKEREAGRWMDDVKQMAGIGKAEEEKEAEEAVVEEEDF